MPSEEQEAESIRRQLQRVLMSAQFARSERLSQFLRFVVEQHLAGKDKETKESSIAIVVFGRKPDYEPKRDSIVRTEAGRLRARLIGYYAGEGSQDPIVIELPKGGYAPVIHFQEKPPAAASRRAETRATRRWLMPALAGLAVVLAAVVWGMVHHRDAPLTIAVLPLDNLTRDGVNDYFADGLTVELIRNLSIIDGLAVRSQTSSLALKGKLRNVREMARQLDAQYILEGSVLRIGQRVRIDIQLVRVRGDLTVWSGSFDRPLTDIHTIQSQISLGIVNNLGLKLGGSKRRYETSAEAYDLYLRASSLQKSLGVQGFIHSIGLFERVVAIDPSFAPAYAGLGADYAIRSIQFPVDHPANELSRMRTAAEMAVQLDPLLAEAHEALALVFARDGKWDLAEESFHRAIEIDPNRSSTHVNFALWHLYVLGRKREALEQLRLAQRTDPLSSEIQRDLALLLISVGRYDEAANSCVKWPANAAWKNDCLAWARLGQGRTKEGVQLLENAPDLSTNPQARGFLGFAYARSGRRAKAEQMAIDSDYPNEQALIFSGLGNKERTLTALDGMATLGPQRVGMYLNYPELALVLADPRLKTLRKKIGLPE